MENKFDSKKLLEKWKNIPYTLFDKIGIKHPKLATWCVWLFVLIIIMAKFLEIDKRIKESLEIKVLGQSKESEQTVTPIPFQTEDPVLKRFYDEKNTSKCNGAEFSILKEGFTPVGGERFTYESDSVVSVRETEGYQAVVRSLWGCKMPFEVKMRIFPQSGKSLGLLFEYENVFRVILGDGDRKTIVVQENKWTIRGQWPEVLMENDKLSFPIEDGEEVLLTVNARVEKNEVIVDINVRHSKFQSVDNFQAKFIPNGTNFNANQSEKFRVGINDSFYKGLGSVIKFDNFSVKELDK